MKSLQDNIINKIYFIRNQRVMLDSDLASLYGVETKVLNQSVQRNLIRFPEDFMFKLNELEWENLRSQFVTSSIGGRRYLPFVFTEQGVAMLSAVLKSETAILVNIHIIRVFAQMREHFINSRLLLEKVEKIELILDSFENSQIEQDHEIHKIFKILDELMSNPNSLERKRIGF
jgi:hypothetical protein